MAEAKKPVVSRKARCGHPDNPVNDDEKAIRKQIESTSGKFDKVNRTVEIIRLKYLVNYPLQLGCRKKTTARDDEDSKLVYDTIARLNNETVNIIDAATREFGAYLSNTNLKRHHFPNSVDDLIA